MRLALLCPGQGDQYAAMFDFATPPPAWQLDTVLGIPQAQVLASAMQLFSNRMAQPMVVAATLAAWEAIRHLLPTPVLVAGYSVGELSAYAVAGALNGEQVLRLAALRAELMNAQVKQNHPQAMSAIAGVGKQQLLALITPHQIAIAIEISESNFIIGGEVCGLQIVEPLLQQQGGSITRLAVNIASHTPHMQAAEKPFLAALSSSGMVDPQIPVLAGINASLIRDRNTAKQTLAAQIAAPIQWAACMDQFAENNITVAIELGPGSALSRMLSQRHPHIATRSIADFRTIDGFARWAGVRS